MCCSIGPLVLKMIFFHLGLDMQPGAVGFTMTTTPCLDIVTLIASLNVRNIVVQ